MACEAKRGCGYRKVGGLYLVGSGAGLACDRLPIPLEICACCGQGIKQTRGFTWVDVHGLVGGDHIKAGARPDPNNPKYSMPGSVPCPCHPACPLCHNTASMSKAGLLWIGAQFYPTIEAFEAEARVFGVSRRITTLPRGFELGKTWILFAHARGVIKPSGDLTAKYVPAIFRVWKPQRVERIYKESDKGGEAVQADEKRGITPVYVPDNDRDHQGSVYDKDEEPSGTALPSPALDFGQ